MSRIQSALMLLVVFTAIASTTGCGGPSDQPQLGQVTGTITFNGKPLSGVAVVFQPVSGRPARGMTDSEGKYELNYIRQTKGTKVGLNRVEIAPSEDGEGEESESTDEQSQPTGKKSKSGKPAIPARYNAQSELKVEVKAGENTFDFKLES